MKKLSLWFLRITIVWIFSLLLALLPFATAINTPDANGWSALIRKNAVLALPSGSGTTRALTGMNSSERTVPSVPAVTSEVIAQCDTSLHSFGAAAAIVAPHLTSDNATPIHFQLADSLVYMQASLNGSEPLWMMLDTGSSVTVFDESVSRTLGLQPLGEGIAYGPGQGSAQKLAFANHATISFAGAELGDQTVATLPLEWFSREVGRSTDGFLGSNVFRNYVVEIDYANQLLRLYDPPTYSYSGPGQRLPLEFMWDDIPTVHAEVVAQDGRAISGIFLIDSGASNAIWLTKAFSEEHPELLLGEETVELANVTAVGGEFSARLGRVPAIKLGGFLVSNPITEFSQNTSGIFATPGLAGTIGAQILRRFTVIFDYSHREMILEPNEHFHDQPE